MAPVNLHWCSRALSHRSISHQSAVRQSILERSRKIPTHAQILATGAKITLCDGETRNGSEPLPQSALEAKDDISILFWRLHRDATSSTSCRSRLPRDSGQAPEKFPHLHLEHFTFGVKAFEFCRPRTAYSAPWVWLQYQWKGPSSAALLGW